MMEEEQEEVLAIEMRLTLPALRVLYDSVADSLTSWEGIDDGEKENLEAMQMLLQAAILELVYDME